MKVNTENPAELEAAAASSTERGRQTESVQTENESASWPASGARARAVDDAPVVGAPRSAHSAALAGPGGEPLSAPQPAPPGKPHVASAGVPGGGLPAFTWGTLAGVGGASVGVTTITGTLSAAFQWAYPTWLPFVVALALVVLADVSVPHPPTTRGPMRPVLWLLNACLVFTTAVGGSHLVLAPASPGLATSSPSPSPSPSQETASSPERVESAEPNKASTLGARQPAPLGEPPTHEATPGPISDQTRPARAVDRSGGAAASTRSTQSKPGHAQAPTRPASGSQEPATRGAPTAKGFKRLGEIHLF